jgi:DNA-binding response OmpR family regulator
MPKMSGYEVLQRVAEMESRPAVIVITAMTDADVPQMDGQVVSSIIRKPFDIDIVSGLLREIAATHSSTGSDEIQIWSSRAGGRGAQH